MDRGGPDAKRARLEILAGGDTHPPVLDTFRETATAGGTNERPAGEADDANDSAVAGDEFANVAASKEPTITANAVFAAKNVAAASREDDALAPETLAAATAAPPAGAVHTHDAFCAPGDSWSPARTAATPSSSPDSPWTRPGNSAALE